MGRHYRATENLAGGELPASRDGGSKRYHRGFRQGGRLSARPGRFDSGARDQSITMETHRMKHTLLTILSFVLLLGCGNPLCNEDCTPDEGCAKDLSCLPVQGGGHKCMPDQCTTCTAAHPVCSFTLYQHTDSADTCTFNTCQ
jgi:hypothetical protein